MRAVSPALSPRRTPARTAALAAEAARPDAPPERLAELATDPEADVLRAVVANPNTPPRALLPLADRFLDEFLANPVAPLLPLEMPDFVDSLTPLAHLKLLRHGATPAVFAQVLARHPDGDVALAASRHVSLTGELDPMAGEWEGRARALVSGLPLGDVGALRELQARGFVPAWLAECLPPAPVVFGGPQVKGRRFALRGAGLAPLHRFLVFARDASLERRDFDAGANSYYPLFRLAVALNPATPTAFRERLAGDGDSLARAAARRMLADPAHRF